MPNPKVLLKHGSESYAIGILCTHEHNGKKFTATQYFQMRGFLG